MNELLDKIKSLEEKIELLEKRIENIEQFNLSDYKSYLKELTADTITTYDGSSELTK